MQTGHIKVHNYYLRYLINLKLFIYAIIRLQIKCNNDWY